MGLQDKMKKSTEVQTSTSTITKESKSNRPPEGAEIIDQTIRTTTEEIENGWLLTKSFSGRYKEKGSKDTYGNYFDYSQKWYSKEDPLTVTLNDKTLAEAFEED